VLTVLSMLIDSNNIRAVTADGTRYAATVVARDAECQMALLQLADPETPDTPITGLPAFADLSALSSASLRPGDWIVAAGNSFNIAQGAEPVSLALGVFSGRTQLDARRRIQDYPFRGPVLAIDAVTTNPGAPGGPLVELDGRWVGMVGRVVVANATHTQLNHAFEVEQCVEFLRQARDPQLRAAAEQQRRQRKRANRADPGIELFEMAYKKKLVFVERVRPTSPAARAGLKADDLIISANSRNVPDLAAFRRVLDGLRPGDTLELVVIRDDRHQTITIKLDADE
jgi:serine protease Do